MYTNKNHDAEGMNILALLRFLASYWKWYILSVTLFLSYFIYNYARTPLVYRRSATVMIRNSDNVSETIRLRRSSSLSSQTNGSVEIQQLRTKELMRNVITRINADVSYTIADGLRKKELYLESPVTVSFLDAAPRSSFSFMLTLKDDNCIELDGFFADPNTMLVNLEDTVSTPVGRMIITRTDNYKQEWMKTPIVVTKYDLESMVNYYQSNLTIFQPKVENPILELVITDKSGLRAADMLYTLINIFNEKSIEEKNRLMVNTSKFISDRLNIIEQDLGSVESKLEMLKAKNEGLDIATAASLYIGDSREYKSENKELENRLQSVSYMIQYLATENQPYALIPNIIGLESPDIEKQITQYNQAVLKRNRLSEGNNLNNPVVREIDNSLILMRKNLLVDVETLYNNLEIVKSKNTKDEMLAREKVRDIPVKQREALSIERQQKVKEELYIYLLNKREENALNGAVVDSNVRIIDPPAGSISPISPVKLKKIALGAGCGLFFPTFILILLFKFDTRVRSRKDVERAVSIPFLGCIPFNKKKKTEDPIWIRADGKDALTESFRILRANLGFLATQNKEKKVITCISFNPGAGKTFVSLNLAACFSFMDKKVIILDLDLRKATLSNLTKTKKLKGISHYLSDESIEINEIIHPNLFGSKIDMMPAGAIPPNPSELLISERLDQLIAELKSMYDYILIDNVPIGMVADSVIIDRATDINIFIIRSGKLDRSQLSELEQLYKNHKLKNMGVVLNGVDKHSEFGYGYGYGYGEKG